MNAFQSAPEKKKKLTLLSLYVGIIGSILISASQSTMLPAAALEIGGQEIYSLVSTLTGVVTLVIGMLGVAQGMKVAFIISLVIAVLAFLSGLPLKKPGEEKAA